MLGVCLLFVGIVLINNGMCTLYNVDGKSTAVMNIFTGGLSLFINFVNLVQGNYYAAGTGLLFCFTYLFVAFSRILKLSPIPFAWFSTFVAINAVVFGTIEGFLGSKTLGITPDIRWAGIWYLWAILWGTAFVEDIMGKKLGKFVPVLQVIEGVITAWVPGVMLLLEYGKNRGENLCFVKKFWGKLKDFDLTGKTVEYVDIEWHEAFKKIHRKTTDSGREVGIRLDDSVLTRGLFQDDVIYADEKLVIAVNTPPCEVIEVSLEPGHEKYVAKVCYEIGNRHAPLFWGDQENTFITIYNEPMMVMLEKLHGVRAEKKTLKLDFDRRISASIHNHHH